VSTIRRARPLLGTLVEVGVAGMVGTKDAAGGSADFESSRAADLDATGAPDASALAATMHAIDAAFAEVVRVERLLSRFDPASDIGRFNAAACGASLDVSADTATVLRCAATLHAESDGAFDVSTGSAPRGWSLDAVHLVKHDAAARLDLGGIGKGYAVDRAIAVLEAHGCSAGWVNAGGDLRAFGAVEVPLWLRDEDGGGVRHFGVLADGAFATSRFGPGARAALAGARSRPMHVAGAGAPAGRPPHAAHARHVSVAAPTCMLADALAKVVASSADSAHPLLARHGAHAFVHDAGRIEPRPGGFSP
jgi:thiamine biosynthesis lipoprotein